MNSTNPYTPPFSKSHSRQTPNATRETYWVAIVASAFIGSIYVLILVAAIYEYVRATPPLLTTDYVRTAIASTIFALLSFTTTILFVRKKRIAKWLLIASPTLLIVFFYPGLNPVCNFVSRNL